MTNKRLIHHNLSGSNVKMKILQINSLRSSKLTNTDVTNYFSGMNQIWHMKIWQITSLEWFTSDIMKFWQITSLIWIKSDVWRSDRLLFLRGSNRQWHMKISRITSLVWIKSDIWRSDKLLLLYGSNLTYEDLTDHFSWVVKVQQNRSEGLRLLCVQMWQMKIWWITSF